MFEKVNDSKAERIIFNVDGGLKTRIKKIEDALPEGTIFPYKKMLAEHLAALVAKAEKKLEKELADNQDNDKPATNQHHGQHDHGSHTDE